MLMRMRFVSAHVGEHPVSGTEKIVNGCCDISPRQSRVGDDDAILICGFVESGRCKQLAEELVGNYTQE